MARTVIEIRSSCPFSEAQRRVEGILTAKGFHPTTLKTGENVWKNGTGLMTAMKFIKPEYAEGLVTLSAWIQAGIGSVGGKEMDLTGVVGAVPKKQLMKVLEELKAAF